MENDGRVQVEEPIGIGVGPKPAPAFAVDGLPASGEESGGNLPHPQAAKRWLRAAFSFPAMLTVLLMTIVFTMARDQRSDPDIWWHLRNAEFLLRQHQLPRQDFYSFTAAGHPWINHEWLAEVPYYFAWRMGNLGGLKALELGLIEAIFLGLLYLCYTTSGNFKSSVLVCCFSVFLGVVSFGPRTILFGYLYLVLLLIILERFRRLGHAPLWLIPPLFCLWINTHGSWSLGLIVFGIFTAAGLLEGEWGRIQAQRWTAPQLRKLVVTGLASVLALFVNPFGYRLVWYPFDLAFRQRLNITHVTEWVSVDFHQGRGKVVLVLLIVLLLTALVRNCRWRLGELAWLLFGLYLGLNHIRFLLFLAIIAAPLLAQIFNFLPPFRAREDKPLLNAVFIILLIAGMVRYYPGASALERGLAREYPVEMLPFLRTHALAGPVLNDYLWGGYLGWEVRDLKVFIDSRVDIFEYCGVFRDYLDVMALKNVQPITDKYQIRYVLFSKDQPLTYALRRDRDWRVIAEDHVAVLLERVGGARAVAGAGR